MTNKKRAIYVEMLTEVQQLTHNTMALFKRNKSVYIANHTYWFCWQYAIMLVWKTWLDVKSVKLMELAWIRVKLYNLISFKMFFTFCGNNWLNWHLINCFFTIQSALSTNMKSRIRKLLVLTNELSSCIWFTLLI